MQACSSMSSRFISHSLLTKQEEPTYCKSDAYFVQPPAFLFPVKALSSTGPRESKILSTAWEPLVLPIGRLGPELSPTFTPPNGLAPVGPATAVLIPEPKPPDPAPKPPLVGAAAPNCWRLRSLLAKLTALTSSA